MPKKLAAIHHFSRRVGGSLIHRLRQDLPSGLPHVFAVYGLQILVRTT